MFWYVCELCVKEHRVVMFNTTKFSPHNFIVCLIAGKSQNSCISLKPLLFWSPKTYRTQKETISRTGPIASPNHWNSVNQVPAITLREWAQFLAVCVQPSVCLQTSPCDCKQYLGRSRRRGEGTWGQRKRRTSRGAGESWEHATNSGSQHSSHDPNPELCQ